MITGYQKILQSKTVFSMKSGEKAAYLSAPANWSDEIHSQILQRIRGDLPDLQIDSFRTLVTVNQILDDSVNLRDLIQSFILGASVLIVATDSARVVGPGIKFEINMARRSGKRIILFDVTEGVFGKFFGYDLIGGGSVTLRRGLRTKAEKEELARRLKKRLRKREKEQRRLAQRMAEGGTNVR